MKGLRRPPVPVRTSNRSSIGVTIAGIQIILIILINLAHHGSKYFVFSFHQQYIHCALMLNASIVHVIFLSACDTNGPPSTQKRFLQSCAWLHLFNAERFGSLPIRTVPAS